MSSILTRPTTMVGLEPTKTNLEFVILPLNYIVIHYMAVGNWLKVWYLFSTKNSKPCEGKEDCDTG